MKKLNISCEELKRYIAEHPDKSLREIADDFGCSKKTIQRMVKKYHISRKLSRNHFEETIEQYIAKHPEQPLEEVAEIFDCPIHILQKRIEEYGFQKKKTIDREDLEQYLTEHPEKSIKEIAKVFGCGVETLRKILQQYGIVRRQVRKSLFKEALLKYIAEHPEDSLEKIATHFGCSATTIHKNIQEYGIQRKTIYKKRVNIQKEALSEYLAEHPEDSFKKIATHFGCSASTILNKMQEYGIQRKRKKQTIHELAIPEKEKQAVHKIKISKEELEQYLSEHPNQTNKQIAEYFHCNLSTIQYHKKQIREKKQMQEKLEQYIVEHPDKTFPEIAGAFGFSTSAFERMVKKYDIQVECELVKNKLFEYETQERIMYSPKAMEQYLAEHPQQSLKEIAFFLGGYPTALEKKLQKYGIARKEIHHYPVKIRDIAPEELRQYMSEHTDLTLMKIAENFGCSISSLQRILVQYDIPF